LGLGSWQRSTVTARRLEVILDAIHQRMRRERRVATDAEIEAVRREHAKAEANFYSTRLARSFGIATESVPPPPDWGDLYAGLIRDPFEAGGGRRQPRHRPPDRLPKTAVERCREALGERQRLGNPRTGRHTLDAISMRVHLPRARVTQIERLMELGWPLLRTHPDYPAEDDHVRLPSIDMARRMLADS
jgi:hypothetical protein